MTHKLRPYNVELHVNEQGERSTITAPQLVFMVDAGEYIQQSKFMLNVASSFYSAQISRDVDAPLALQATLAYSKKVVQDNFGLQIPAIGAVILDNALHIGWAGSEGRAYHAATQGQMEAIDKPTGNELYVARLNLGDGYVLSFEENSHKAIDKCVRDPIGDGYSLESICADLETEGLPVLSMSVKAIDTLSNQSTDGATILGNTRRTNAGYKFSLGSIAGLGVAALLASGLYLQHGEFRSSTVISSEVQANALHIESGQIDMEPIGEKEMSGSVNGRQKVTLSSAFSNSIDEVPEPKIAPIPTDREVICFKMSNYDDTIDWLVFTDAQVPITNRRAAGFFRRYAKSKVDAEATMQQVWDFAYPYAKVKFGADIDRLHRLPTRMFKGCQK
jgi:hypothetical protein